MSQRKEINIDIEEKYKRLKTKWIITLVLFVAFVLATTFYLYLNYNYLVFKHLISQNYIFTGTLDEIYKERLKENDYKSYYSSFDEVVISIVTEEIRQKNNDVYTYLYLPEQLKKSKDLDKEESKYSEVREISEDIVYFRLTNFSKYTEKILNENKDTLNSYKNLILDLRQNRGGDTGVLKNIANLFLPSGSIISIDNTISPFFSVTEKAKGNAFFHYDNILILQDKNTASSSEGLIAALKDNLPNVVLVGDTTFGKGIGQITFPLKKGYAVKATVLLWYTPLGKSIHKEGITPDYFYDGDNIEDFGIGIIGNN